MLSARQGPRHGAERITAMFVAAPLIPRRTGRREQDHHRSARLASSQRVGGIERRLQVAAATVFQFTFELTGEQVGRLTNQEDVTDTIEIGSKRRNASLLRLATGNPVDVAVT